MADFDNVATILEAGRKIRSLELQGVIHQQEGGRPFIVMPNGDVKDMEPWAAAPTNVRACVAVADAASFVEYVNRFKDAGSVVFADLEGRSFTAILDYHRPDEGDVVIPRWGSHRLSYACAPTQDWRTWSDANNTPSTQEAFARFIENNLPNIVEPAGADLLQIAMTLEAKKSVDFRSSTRLADGQTQFRYEETLEGRANGTTEGSIVVPTTFVLGLEPFAGIGLKRVDARFRYRLKEAKLTMWFELVRADDVLRKAFEEVTYRIRAGIGDTVVLSGPAPK